MFNEPSSYSSASSNRSVKTAIEGNEDGKQDRQVSLSSGESLDDVRYRTRMSIADDLATMAKVGGNIIWYTGQSIGQGINMAVDAHNWMNEDEEDDEEPEREAFALLREAPINEEVFEQTQHIIRRGASRSRSPEQNEQASGSNDAIRLLRRGASRSRSASRTSGEASRSSTPPKKNEEKYREILTKLIFRFQVLLRFQYHIFSSIVLFVVFSGFVLRIVLPVAFPFFLMKFVFALLS